MGMVTGVDLTWMLAAEIIAQMNGVDPEDHSTEEDMARLIQLHGVWRDPAS